MRIYANRTKNRSTKKEQERKQKPFQFLFTIFYLWGKNRIDVACRFDSVSFFSVQIFTYMCACVSMCRILIGKKENHMWNKYMFIYNQIKYIQRKKSNRWISIWSLYMSLAALIKPSENRFNLECGLNFRWCCCSSFSCFHRMKIETRRSQTHCDGEKCRCWFLADCVLLHMKLYTHAFDIFEMQIRADIHSIRLHV